MLVCVRCRKANGNADRRCAQCGASLNDAIVFKSAHDFQSDQAKDYLKAMHARHRRMHLIGALATYPALQMVAQGIVGGMTPAWWALPLALGAATVLIVHHLRLGMLSAMGVQAAMSFGAVVIVDTANFFTFLLVLFSVGIAAFLGAWLKGVGEMHG